MVAQHPDVDINDNDEDLDSSGFGDDFHDLPTRNTIEDIGRVGAFFSGVNAIVLDDLGEVTINNTTKNFYDDDDGYFVDSALLSQILSADAPNQPEIAHTAQISSTQIHISQPDQKPADLVDANSQSSTVKPLSEDRIAASTPTPVPQPQSQPATAVTGQAFPPSVAHQNSNTPSTKPIQAKAKDSTTSDTLSADEQKISCTKMAADSTASPQPDQPQKSPDPSQDLPQESQTLRDALKQVVSEAAEASDKPAMPLNEEEQEALKQVVSEATEASDQPAMPLNEEEQKALGVRLTQMFDEAKIATATFKSWINIKNDIDGLFKIAEENDGHIIDVNRLDAFIERAQDLITSKIQRFKNDIDTQIANHMSNELSNWPFNKLSQAMVVYQNKIAIIEGLTSNMHEVIDTLEVTIASLARKQDKLKGLTLMVVEQEDDLDKAIQLISARFEKRHQQMQKEIQQLRQEQNQPGPVDQEKLDQALVDDASQGNQKSFWGISFKK